jgi:hypothetical protein
MTEQSPTPTVIRISPMAHFASLFVAVAVLVFVPVFGRWSLALLILPAAISVVIERLRTVATAETVTARTVGSSRTLPWGALTGLRFHRGGFARACLPDGSEQVLPAVTFSTLPELAAASGGRVPNPYGRSAEGVVAVKEEPGGDAAGDGQQQRHE